MRSESFMGWEIAFYLLWGTPFYALIFALPFVVGFDIKPTKRGLFFYLLIIELLVCAGVAKEYFKGNFTGSVEQINLVK